MATSVTPAQATFPGQNGKFAYSTFNSDGIFTVNPDGAALTSLTTRGSDSLPSWSPDGGKVVFDRFAGVQWDLWIVDADGSNPHPLTNTEFEGENEGAWSADGSQLVFRAYSEIVKINSDGSGRTILVDTTPVTLLFREPRWSPDGRKIAMRGGPVNHEYDIYTMNPDGTGITNITSTPLIKETAFDWSPDGRKIVFSGVAGNDFEASDIYSMNRDGSGRMNVTNSSGYETDPLWAPDGSAIVFHTGHFGIDAIAPDGTARRHFSDERADDWQPIPGPRRADYKNVSAYCKAVRDFLGEPDFSNRYKNHGACVSANR